MRVLDWWRGLSTAWQLFVYGSLLTIGGILLGTGASMSDRSFPPLLSDGLIQVGIAILLLLEPEPGNRWFRPSY